MPEEVQLGDLRFKKFISKEDIAAKVRELAGDIDKSRFDTTPVFIGVLDGCFIFMADIIRAYGGSCEVSFVKYKSYKGTQSMDIEKLLDIQIDLKNRHVVIVEDIVDTGKTVHTLREQIKRMNPKSIQLISLLFKPDALTIGETPDAIGFSIPNDFVVGYGLDYNEKGRELSSIYKLMSVN